MDAKLKVYGKMPDEATKALIENYLKQNDRMAATDIRWFSVDTPQTEAARLRLENKALRDQIAILEAEEEEVEDGS